MIGNIDRIVLLWTEGGKMRCKKIQISEQVMESQPPLQALPVQFDNGGSKKS
jgi:hypothetical protein